MKIGILTLPLHSNYGGILQAWALQTVLERMGHEVQVLSPYKYRGGFPWRPTLKRLVLKCLMRPCDVAILHDVRVHGRKAKIRKFVCNRMYMRRIDSLKRLASYGYDAIVVGSDQIWRKEYIRYLWGCEDVAEAFLSMFPDAGPVRVAYAASLGVDEWCFDKSETERIGKALSSYRAVSLREKSGVATIRSATGVDAQFMADPTMLLGADDYRRLADVKKTSGGGVVSYILDPTDAKNELIRTVMLSKKLPHTELNCAAEAGKMLSVEEWLAGIAGSDIVITDSFHGCVFSIIFNKKLIFMTNDHRGNARFDTLIEVFNIGDNRVIDVSEYDSSKSYALPADISDRISRLRTQSEAFLANALENK